MPSDQGSGTGKAMAVERGGTLPNNLETVDTRQNSGQNHTQHLRETATCGKQTPAPSSRSPKATECAGPNENPQNRWTQPPGKKPIYGALDLGTNNCRLLLAEPNSDGFQIVDAFSRIIRLGEGVSQTNKMSNEAMKRTIAALKICADKMKFHDVTRSRLVATEACRAAKNSNKFLNKVKQRTGLSLEIISQETEAKLAVSSCVPLIDQSCDYVLIFDIGGGSSELIWLDIKKINSRAEENSFGAEDAIVAWISLPVGVVSLADKFGGEVVDQEKYRKMVGFVKTLLDGFAHYIAETTIINKSNVHFLGTSGTVTTMAGIHLQLEYYDRQKVDGAWMHVDEIGGVSRHLLNLDNASRAAEPCIGHERADLVLGGCAILEAMLEIWPTSRLRVADRGLREGILAKLMIEDGYIQPGQHWTSQPKAPHVQQSQHYKRP